MPDTVQTSYNCRFRGHESVAHPYGKDSVLLPEGLTGGDVVRIRRQEPHKRGSILQKVRNSIAKITKEKES